MRKATRTGPVRLACGCLLTVASAGCSAREQAPATSAIQHADEMTGSPALTPGAAPGSSPEAQGNDVVTRPGPPPTPGKQPSSPPRPTVQPSPWQPPAEIDPVRRDVGNETPG